MTILDTDRLFNEREAALFLRVSERKLQQLRSFGGGPTFIRLSKRCIRYRHADLMTWLSKRSVGSTSEYSTVELLPGNGK